ncbi:MAG: DUF2147 domain-containing protein [Chitinophagales bacterium]
MCLIWLFSGFFMSLVAQDANKILGKWLNNEKDASVEIYREGDKFYGKIVWLKLGRDLADEHNANVHLQKRPLYQLDVLKDFTYEEATKEWQNGTIYDPKSGQTYSCKMWLNVNKTLSIRGFVGFSFIGRTDIWQRPKQGHAVYH